MSEQTDFIIFNRILPFIYKSNPSFKIRNISYQDVSSDPLQHKKWSKSNRSLLDSQYLQGSSLCLRPDRSQSPNWLTCRSWCLISSQASYGKYSDYPWRAKNPDERHNPLKSVFKSIRYSIQTMDDFAKVNAIYGTYFTPENYPSRCAFAVAELPKGGLI